MALANKFIGAPVSVALPELISAVKLETELGELVEVSSVVAYRAVPRIQRGVFHLW